MRSLLAIVIMALSLVLTGCSTSSQTKPLKRTFSSFDLPSDHNAKDLRPVGNVDFQGLPLDQVLAVYAANAGRTVILGGNLPDVRLNFSPTTPLNRIQLLQMFDTILAQHGIAMVLSGEDAVKAVPISQINSAIPPEINLPWKLLPESSSAMTRTVHLKRLKPTEISAVLMPFAGLPGSIMAIDSQQMIILRDYSANIRQQLRLLEELELKQSR